MEGLSGMAALGVRENWEDGMPVVLKDSVEQMRWMRVTLASFSIIRFGSKAESGAS